MSSSGPKITFFAAAAAAGAFAYFAHRQSKAKGSAPGRDGGKSSAGSAKLCIASCRELLAHADGSSATFGHAACDDKQLYDALRRRGVLFDVKAWDDETVNWSDYSVVAVRTTWDYSQSEAVALRFKLWIERLVGLGRVRVYNHPRILSWNMSKFYLQELHAECGIPVIPTLYYRPQQQQALQCAAATAPSSGAAGSAPAGVCAIGSISAAVPSLREVAGQTGWTDLILKPCVSAGSRDTWRVSAADGPAGLERAQRFLSDMLTLGYDTQATDATDGSAAEAAPAAAAGGGSGAPVPPLHHAASRSSFDALAPLEAAREARQLAEAAGRAVRTASAGSARALEEAAAAATAAASDAVAAPGAAAEPFVAGARRTLPGQASGPCSMMVQPYLPSVESAGELSVIVIDGRISHAVEKRPLPGDFRTQEEYGGVQRKVALTPAEEALVYRVLAAAQQVVEAKQPPTSPITMGQLHTLLPRKLPKGSLLIARVDFLRLTPEAYAAAFPSHAPASRISPEATPLLLLELEVIEPCLFFGVDAYGAAGGAGGAGGGKPGAAPVHSRGAEALAAALEERLRPDYLGSEL